MNEPENQHGLQFCLSFKSSLKYWKSEFSWSKVLKVNFFVVFTYFVLRRERATDNKREEERENNKKMVKTSTAGEDKLRNVSEKERKQA